MTLARGRGMNPCTGPATSAIVCRAPSVNPTTGRSFPEAGPHGRLVDDRHAAVRAAQRSFMRPGLRVGAGPALFHRGRAVGATIGHVAVDHLGGWVHDRGLAVCAQRRSGLHLASPCLIQRSGLARCVPDGPYNSRGGGKAARALSSPEREMAARRKDAPGCARFAEKEIAMTETRFLIDTYLDWV